MRIKSKIITSAPVLALSLLVSAAVTPACAGKDEAIVIPLKISQSAATNAAELGVLWEEGKRQEMAGLDQAKEGDKKIKGAQKDVRKAEEKKLKAQSKTDDRRAVYVKTAASLGDAKTPAEASAELKTFKSAVKDWEDAYNDLTKSQDRLLNAQAELASGQALLKNGQAEIELGRQKMRRADILSEPRVLIDSQTETQIEPVELEDF